MVSYAQGVPAWPRMAAACGVSLNPHGYLHITSGEPSPSRIAGGNFHLERHRCRSLRLAPRWGSFTRSFWKRIFGDEGGVGSKNPRSGPCQVWEWFILIDGSD